MREGLKARQGCSAAALLAREGETAIYGQFFCYSGHLWPRAYHYSLVRYVAMITPVVVVTLLARCSAV